MPSMMRQIRETAQENYGEKYNYNLIPQTKFSYEIFNFGNTLLFNLLCVVSNGKTSNVQHFYLFQI